METLRHVLIETLERASRGIEAVVIRHGDGTYESAPKSIFAEITRNDPDAQIVFTVRDLTDFGSVATVEDIPAIVDECILPDWDEIAIKKGVVVNRYGKRLDFEAAVNFMDDDLREQLHMQLAPCTNQEFFDAYAKAHLEKFGEEFEPNKENPVW